MHHINKTRKKTKIAKYLFLLSGIFVLFLIFIIYLTKETSPIKNILKFNDSPEVAKKINLTMNNLVFEGQSKENIPYKIIAKAVTRENNNIYNLRSIGADYKLFNGNLDIAAESGILDKNTNKFTLSENVQISFNDLVMHVERINLDLDANSAISDASVEINFKNSIIKAKNFNASQAGNIINFTGDVSSKFDKTLISTNKDLIITSDSLKLDNNESVVCFEGLVTVLFDDIILKTECIKIYYTQTNGKQTISKIEIPDKLKAIKISTNEIVTSDKGEYIVSSNELILNQHVVMNKDENIVITDKMVYVTKLK